MRFDELTALAATSPAGRERRALHAVARGRTLTDRQQAPARGLHEPLADDDDRRPRARGPGGRRREQRVAARLRGEVRRSTAVTRCGCSAVARSPASGARSTPTRSHARSNRSPNRWSRNFAARRSWPPSTWVDYRLEDVAPTSAPWSHVLAERRRRGTLPHPTRAVPEPLRARQEVVAFRQLIS